MDLDGTLSTELAMYHNKAQYDAAVIMGLPKTNDGKPMPASQAAGGGFIPKGAKNVTVAKDFMKYFIKPEVMNENLKQGLGRWVPSIPSVVKSDPFWLESKDPHLPPYVREAVLGPTIPDFRGFNPAWGQVNAEQLWGTASADVIKSGMTPSAAIDKTFRRMEAIFQRYTLG
jgi:multiple sugar transport system substrate-binding protein